MFPRKKIQAKLESIFDGTTSLSIEESIFNYTINESKKLNLVENDPISILIYTEKARSIFDNFNPKSYFDTKEALKKFDNLTPSEIVSHNIQDFRHKNLWKAIQKNQEILDKNLMGLKPTTETDQFLCKKCKQRKTTFYTMQIRSADEAETSFITCLNCGYSWREG